MFAKVIIDISHEAVDRPFEYIIPDELLDKVSEGSRIVVPFGNGNKARKAYVVGISKTPEYPVEKLKKIIALDEKAIGVEDKIFVLAAWMRHRYGCTLNAALQTVLPVKKKIKENTYKMVSLKATGDALDAAIDESKKSMRYMSRLRLLKELQNVEKLPLSIIVQKLGVSQAVVDTLAKKGIVEIETIKEYRNPKAPGMAEKNITLSMEQNTVIDNITERMKSGDPGTTVLHGITGSGKTEVYIELIKRCIEDGKKAIVLIPEIALTFQTLMRFYAKFGDRVSVIHSRLSDGERYDQYEKARRGELDIIIGPRSALFTPFENIGIIIIDEEHETSYKSEKMPKYHAREVAEYIAKREGALLLLGSATPSIDSYYKTRTGEYNLEVLSSRNGGATPAQVHIADMRAELKSGNKSYFSKKLKELLTDRLVKGEQAMLFINRRGIAGFISCRDCGYVMKCPHCDVSLSEHNGGKMECHYCGYTVDRPTLCPECSSKYFAGFRAGTEKIEAEIKKIYPSARVLRMDADTTKSKDDYEKILSSFASREADILVGTQMIVKGHDFPNVTLVGVIAADLSLYASDYRAAERTFQLVTQAAGRAGRGIKKGDTVIQTYQPDNYAIMHAKNQDYVGFYNEEVLYRDLSDYPPVSHMMALQIYSVDERLAEEVADTIVTRLRGQFNDKVIIGPSKALISKLRDIHRQVIYVKDASLDTLIEMKDYVDIIGESLDKRKVSVQYDVDPVGSF